MSKLKEIMVQYATQRGGGLPLTPEEMCNALVLWVESVFDNLSIEGGYLVQVQKEGTQFTININTEQLDADIKGHYFNANDLSELFEGSETVVVDVNNTHDKIEIHLDADVVRKIERAILIPQNTPTEDVVPIVTDTNDIDYVPLSQIGGGGGTKLYKHTIIFTAIAENMYFITTSNNPFTNASDIYTRFNFETSDIIRGWLNANSALVGGQITDIAIDNSSEDRLYILTSASGSYTIGRAPFDVFTDTVTPL